MLRQRFSPIVMCRTRILCTCLGLLGMAMLSPKVEPSSRPPTQSVSLAGSALPCSWSEVSGERLLDRRVGDFSVTDVRVEVAVAQLSDKTNLPLSFIQAEPEAKVSLDLRGATVRQVLDGIVAHVPRYRYGIVSGRLVLYPSDPKWELRIDDLRLGPGPRLRMTKDLASELSRRLPQFATFGGPWVSGDGYTYRDVVSVVGPASVLELLVQLLGSRPSTYFIVVKEAGWLGSSLSVCSIAQLRSIKLSAPDTTLRRRDETVQLKLVGTLEYSGSPKDLTDGACGTVYSTSDERVLTVSPTGLVRVRGSGKAKVKASNEHYSDSVTFDCHVEDQ
jgi:hypothetical protein